MDEFDPEDGRHRYSVETSFARYYADRFELHMNGSVEWWCTGLDGRTIHRLLTEDGRAEITEEIP